MFESAHHRGRTSPLAPAVVMLLALCLLAGGAQGADVPRFVVGDVLEIDFANQTEQVLIAHVDTTSLPTPYYTAYPVVQNAGRWEIPRYWHGDLQYTEEQLVDNEQARRVAHVDPVLVTITDETITGGDMQYTGLSLAEAKTIGAYWVEQPPGESSGYSNSYVAGDILGNVSDTNRGAVVSRVYESDGAPWARVYFDTVRSGDRWMIEKFYNGDMGFPMNMLGQNESRRVAHADPHTVIINDTTTNTGEIGWYRLSLAEFLAGRGYDHMGAWHFNPGDILGNGTATRYIVGNATVSEYGPSHYTLYVVVSGTDGWEIPAYVNAGIPLETPLGVQLDGIPYDLVDHTDPHFAVVTDASVENGLTYAGLSLGEILEGTPGYPVEMPPVGGDRGYFLVSTVPAGADIYLVDISGTRYLQGNTGAGPLNVTIVLTATPMKQIVATLPGYGDAFYTVTQYPLKGETLAVSLTLAKAGGGTPYRQHPVPGRIQAEEYDLGGEGVAYHDTTPGNTGGAYRRDDVDIETIGGVTNVGWIREGEHLRYTVNVTQDGLYLVSLRVASPNSGRTVEVSFDGGRPITYRVPNTGSFVQYATATLGSTTCPNSRVTVTQTPTPMATGIENQRIPVQLSGGVHVIELAFHGDGQNLDWLEILPDGTAPPPDGPSGQPYPGTHVVPGRVESEDYDTGGFADTTPANEGGAYRADAVDIERGGSNYNVGWIRPGEHLEYTVAAQSAASYQVAFRVANPGPAKTVTVRVNGVAKTLAIPSTGSFATWQTATLPAGWLPAGQNTVRVESGAAGSFNLDYMQFTVGETQPPTTVITTPTTPVQSGGASFTAAPLSAPKGAAVKFTVMPAGGKAIRSAWWSFDAPAHLNTWNSRATNPTFFYPARGTFSPLVKLVYSDGSTETVQRTNFVRAT